MNSEAKVLQTPGSGGGAVELSGRICETEQLFLGLPTQRKIAAAGAEKLSGQFWRLAAFGNSLYDPGREKAR